MELTDLFDLVYSNEISEESKTYLIDAIISEAEQEEVSEAAEECVTNEALVDAVNLLVENAVSEELLLEAIEMIFSSMDVETINSVTESFKERAICKEILEREEAISELFGLFGKSAERKGAENISKVAAKDVKRAQAALKKAQAKSQKSSSPIGMAGLDKGSKSNQGVKSAQSKLDKAVAAHKQSQAELKEVKDRERKESIDKLKGAAKGVWNRFKEGAKAVANKVKDTAVAAKDKTIEAAGKVKDATKKGVAGAARGIASGATKVANKLDPQTSSKVNSRLQGHLDAAKSKQLVKESCLPVLELLSRTTISESSFLEIIESLAYNSATVKKALDNKQRALEDVENSIHSNIEKGEEVPPNKIKAAEKIASKCEKYLKKYQGLVNAGK